MPLFHLDVRSATTFIEDDDGADFADLAAATEEARTSALQIAQHRLRDGLDAISVEVRDEEGVIALTVTVSVTVARR